MNLDVLATVARFSFLFFLFFSLSCNSCDKYNDYKFLDEDTVWILAKAPAISRSSLTLKLHGLVLRLS